MAFEQALGILGNSEFRPYALSLLFSDILTNHTLPIPRKLVVDERRELDFISYFSRPTSPSELNFRLFAFTADPQNFPARPKISAIAWRLGRWEVLNANFSRPERASRNSVQSSWTLLVLARFDS